MSSVPPDWYPVQNPRAAWRVYDGEAVIVSPEDSMFHGLNGVATLIWTSADGRTPLGEIVRRIVQEFDVDAAVALADARLFVEDLCGRGLMGVCEGPTAGDVLREGGHE